MIPKLIHYCWFGSNSLSEEHKEYIAGWKKLLPEYEIKLWNETNFDINIVPFTMQVASAKKWGFIVDYIRGYVIYNYGGIYLDVDVELIKPFSDDMLQNKCFSGFENEKLIAPGLIFAGEKDSTIAKDLIDFYSSYDFILEDGELNLTPSPIIFTNILLKYGLKQNNAYQELGIFTAYPTEYFCPMLYKTGKLNITNNTYSIHHYDGSWVLSDIKKADDKRRIIYNIFGDNIISRFLVFFYILFAIILNFFIRFFVKFGPIKTLKYYWKKVTRRGKI